MVAIGVVNILIGLQSYKAPENPARMELPGLHRDGGVDAVGTIGNAALPADVMRAFAIKYPQTIPAGARIDGRNFVISFPPGALHAHATFDTTGAFVGED